MSTETSTQTTTPSEGLPNQNELSNGLPTMDQILNEQAQPAQEQAPVPQQEQEPPAQEQEPPKPDQWAELTAQQRELWKAKKEVSDMKAEIEKLRAENESKYGNIENVVKNFMGDDAGDLDPHNQPGSPDFDPVKYEAELTQKIMEKVQGHTKQTEEQKQLDAEIHNFKSELKGFLSEKAGDFPLTSGMGSEELVFEIIEQQYQKDANEYGYEYADQHMLSSEEATKRAEGHLASEIQKVLQSPHMRDYLLTQINQIRAQNPQTGVENQSRENQSSQTSTLTNNMGQTSSQNQRIDERAMTDEEAFNRALSLVNS